MNAERLLALYDRIADAPDAITRLRRFVLDLAVRGKLVRQDPNDEPALDLLKRISKEKQKLGIKVVTLPAVQPPALPRGWVATTLGNYAIDVFTGPFGSMLHQSDYVRGGVPLINPSHMKNDRIEYDPKVSVPISLAHRMSSYALAAGDIVMARRGEVGRAALVEPGQSGWLCGTGSFFLRFAREVDRNFLLLLLRTSSLRSYLAGRSVGTTMVNLNHGILRSAPLQIPPLAEQHRIVAKVDELMALCDRLEAARVACEAKRDRLTAASLARLTAPDPETFRADARFALDALPALTTRPDQIKQLRQTILSLAVRGKLVRQNPDDKPVLSSESSVPVSGNRLELVLPAGWTWTHVSDVAEARLGKMLDRAKNRGKSYRYLRNTNVHWFDIRLDELKTIPLTEEEFDTYRLQPGDVLICEGGHGIGRTAVWEHADPAMVFQKALHRVRPGEKLDSHFLSFCASVYFHENVMQTYFTGVGIPHFTGRALDQLVFPLPPLAEQRRIVAKVDKLMALCDRLEASLTARDATRSKLLNALLAETLAPVATPDRQAAD
jgi:type I restriction enzyme S subunit